MQWWESIKDWQVWLGLAILLGGAELLTLDLILLMLAAGAVVGMALALVPGVDIAVGLQIVAAAVASVGMLSLVRPKVIGRLHSGPELTLGHSALVGRQGVVVEQVTSQSGQIKIGGELWTARSYDDSDVIDTGSTVEVFVIRGATALVHPVPQLDP